MQLHDAVAPLLMLLLEGKEEEEDTNWLSPDDIESSQSLTSASTAALKCQRRAGALRVGNTRGCEAHSGRSYTA